MKDEELEKVKTIHDVARELGVSTSTVSRSISGKGRIGKDTRERVLKYIGESGYYPNAVAQSLAQSKTNNIGVILPMISTPFMIMMFRQNARSFPIDIIEAARIDGLNEIQIFFRMFFPTMRSTYAAAGVITFMNAWNAYLWPKVIMTDNNSITMPMLIANLITGYVTDYGMLMCGVLFCSIPTMVVFFILQKQFAEGITGAVK